MTPPPKPNPPGNPWPLVEALAKRCLEALRNLLVVGVILVFAEATESPLAVGLAVIGIIALLLSVLAPFLGWFVGRHPRRPKWEQLILATVIIVGLLLLLYYIDEFGQVLLDLMRALSS
jgi:MFS-type transporter involved in bile tolerance (Atg22 family)